MAATHFSGPLVVAGVEVVSSTGAITGDIQATAGSIGTTELAADAVTNAKLADTAVSIENLDSGIAPAYIAKYAGTVTWSGSGASLATTVTGLAATDIVVCTVKVKGTESTTILSAVPTTNTLTVTLDAANTSNDCVFYYVAFRAAA